MTAADLQVYVSAPTEDEDFVGKCYARAEALILAFLGITADARATYALVPADIIEGEVLEVGSRLYHRRQAPLGVSQFATPDGSPVRIARDPMEASYPVLTRYLGPGIA